MKFKRLLLKNSLTFSPEIDLLNGLLIKRVENNSINYFYAFTYTYLDLSASLDYTFSKKGEIKINEETILIKIRELVKRKNLRNKYE